MNTIYILLAIWSFFGCIIFRMVVEDVDTDTSLPLIKLIVLSGPIMWVIGICTGLYVWFLTRVKPQIIEWMNDD